MIKIFQLIYWWLCLFLVFEACLCAKIILFWSWFAIWFAIPDNYHILTKDHPYASPERKDSSGGNSDSE